MSGSVPPLNWFRAFEAAARHLSFTLAAQELNVTQSAISQHIRALEARLGTVLFVRKARGLTLTDSARRLLPFVSGALGELRKATEVFLSPRSEQTLHIACSTSFALHWLGKRLGQFRALFPGSNVRIVNALWPDDYMNYNVSVQIRFGLAELVGEGGTPLGPDWVVPICAPRLARDFPTWSAIGRAPFIRIVGTTDSWERWSELTGFPVSGSADYSVDSHAMAIELARSGLGIALGNQLLCQDLINAGQLVVPIARPIVPRENYFLRLCGAHRDNLLATSFRDWLISAVTDAQGSYGHPEQAVLR